MKENKAVNYSIIFIAAVVLIIVLKYLASIVRPLALGFLITVLVIPIYEFSKRKKIPAIIPLTGLFVLLIVSVYLLGGLLTSETVRFEENIDIYKEQIANSIELLTQNSNIDFSEFNMQKVLTSQAGNKIITGTVSTISTMFTELFLAILFAIFMIPAYRKFIRQLSYKHKNLRLTLMKIQTSTVNYLRTKSIISLGTAASSALILALFHSDFVWTLSIIIFLFNFIPNIGSIIATIIAATLYLLKFGLGIQFFILLALLSIVQGVWGNIIEPHFAGKQLKLSPLLILISIFFWGWLWGVGGMILSIPILAIVKITFEHFKSTQKIAEYMQ